ncbi:hypothetical protein JB92DRAFT_3021974 [Gautieria morchelliformis]|nr:hypothetical protein JB92DRAFT_3021974 [Gautieria morchelliformis]
MTGEHEEYIAIVKALYDYEPSSEDELAMSEGQILFLVERTDDEWWKVKHKPASQDEETGPSGLVPASYVEETEPISVVKALYDYEAVAGGELSIIEGETLLVYGKEEDWLLVKCERDGGKVGYVPGNYVGEGEEPVENDASHIVIPDSPPQRSSVYVDPADRVAATVDKAKADDIQTWSVSEVDKKGKKKKGTLGVGNGAVFFASESDKTPVQKWQTSAIEGIKVEKSKHVHLEIGGAETINLHFNVGSKDTADAIVKKLESSRALSARVSSSISSAPDASLPPESPPPSPISVNVGPAQKLNRNGATVHFAPSPSLIPSPITATAVDGEEEEGEEAVSQGEIGSALYDFVADGEEELSVKEGEQLVILDKVSSDEWWKCRNAHGAEGVVPASYVEAVEGVAPPALDDGDDDTEERERVAREAAERAAAEAEAAAVMARERTERERVSRKQEADRKAKAAATAAKAEKERRDREAREREERAASERDAAKKLQAEATKRVSPDDASHSARPRSSIETQPKFPSEGKTRIWHDHSGQWRTEAEFLGISKGKIRLHKINGVIIEVPPEKMSPDDVRYIERMTNKKLGASSASTLAPRSRGPDDDDLPLALSQRRSQPDPSPTRPTPSSKKGPTVDWFEFFLEAGCEIDDCTRYASSFERDKIDENILPDIKESTLRSLGLREGDIIRVSKAIEKRKPKSDLLKAQLARDEEIAKALQAEEDSGTSSSRANTTSPPNLFTGPSGALKTQQRRGRPQPRGSAPPVNVDVNSIASASDQISRTGSPLVASLSVVRTTSPATVNTPKRGASTQPSGFDDDAWTIRPSSTKPTPTPPVTTSAQSPPPRPVSTSQAQQTQSTQASSQFELLAKIGQMRPPSAPTAQPSMLPRSPPVVTSPPQSFHSGLGMGASPVPLGQHVQNQQTGLYQLPQIGPRGPLAPIPSNQGLLTPLIPTNTGFNQFVPTRPASNPPFSSTAQPSFQPSFQSPAPASFLSTPQTGFGGTGPLMPQQTGFPSVSPQSGMYSSIPPQPNGIGGGFGGSGLPNFMPPSSFGGIQPNPTGFQPSFSQNGGLAPPLAGPPLAGPPQKDHSPANVFAQMKSGTFGDESVPQSADKYDALRPQPTGWQNGFQQQGSYGGF